MATDHDPDGAGQDDGFFSGDFSSDLGGSFPDTFSSGLDGSFADSFSSSFDDSFSGSFSHSDSFSAELEDGFSAGFDVGSYASDPMDLDWSAPDLDDDETSGIVDRYGSVGASYRDRAYEDSHYGRVGAADGAGAYGAGDYSDLPSADTARDAASGARPAAGPAATGAAATGAAAAASRGTGARDELADRARQYGSDRVDDLASRFGDSLDSVQLPDSVRDRLPDGAAERADTRLDSARGRVQQEMEDRGTQRQTATGTTTRPRPAPASSAPRPKAAKKGSDPGGCLGKGFVPLVVLLIILFNLFGDRLGGLFN